MATCRRSGQAVAVAVIDPRTYCTHTVLMSGLILRIQQNSKLGPAEYSLPSKLGQRQVPYYPP